MASRNRSVLYLHFVVVALLCTTVAADTTPDSSQPNVARPSGTPEGGVCGYEIRTDGQVVEIPCRRPITQDGRCGYRFNSVACDGVWGNCCSWDGYCGTGEDYCGIDECDEGDCDFLHPERYGDRLPWQTGTTRDGSCGGPEGLTCDIVYGKCCSRDGVCGVLDEHCGEGCQREFGKCYGRADSTPLFSSAGSAAATTGPAASTVPTDRIKSATTGRYADKTTDSATVSTQDGRGSDDNVKSASSASGSQAVEQEASGAASALPPNESSGASRSRYGFMLT